MQMHNKHVKGRSTWLAIPEMWTQTTKRYHCIRMKTAGVKKDREHQRWAYAATTSLTRCWWGREMVQPLWKPVRQFLTKIDMDFTSEPATPLLGIYARDIKTYRLVHEHHKSFESHSSELETAHSPPAGERTNVVHLYHGISLSSKKEGTPATHSDLNKAQKHYAEPKTRQERVHPVWFHLYKIPGKRSLVRSNRRQTKGCPRVRLAGNRAQGNVLGYCKCSTMWWCPHSSIHMLKLKMVQVK